MPNWCENRLSVSGPKETVAKIIKATQIDQGAFDFNGIVPMPPELQSTISGKPRFYSCGICGWYHSASFDGDCRDDSERFTSFDLDMKYGSEGWEEVEIPV